jgi:hypothetical protein
MPLHDRNIYRWTIGPKKSKNYLLIWTIELLSSLIENDDDDAEKKGTLLEEKKWEWLRVTKRNCGR